MHFLTRQNLHIARFHPLMKVLMSLYIASVLAGLVVAAMKYTDRGVWSTQGVAVYLAGSEDVRDDPFGDPFGGTDDGLAAQEGKTRRELVDIVHPHLFTIPIVLFILGHLLHLTGLRDAWKLAINVTAFVSFLATFLLPFAVAGRPAWAWLQMAAGSLMMVSTLLLCLVPLASMWFGKPGRGFDALPRRWGDAPRDS